MHSGSNGVAMKRI
jgi:ubiquitin-protein ligase